MENSLLNASNETMITNSTTTSAASVYSVVGTFLLNEMKSGYQLNPTLMEINQRCCGWMNKRFDCLTSDDRNNINNIMMKNTSSIPISISNTSTCSSLVVNDLIETMNSSDEIAYCLFLLFMNIILTISLLIGANSSKYKLDIDALNIISKIELKGLQHKEAISKRKIFF